MKLNRKEMQLPSTSANVMRTCDTYVFLCIPVFFYLGYINYLSISQKSRHWGILLRNRLENQSNFEEFERDLSLNKKKKAKPDNQYLFLKFLS